MGLTRRLSKENTERAGAWRGEAFGGRRLARPTRCISSAVQAAMWCERLALTATGYGAIWAVSYLWAGRGMTACSGKCLGSRHLQLPWFVCASRCTRVPPAGCTHNCSRKHLLAHTVLCDRTHQKMCGGLRWCLTLSFSSSLSEPLSPYADSPS